MDRLASTGYAASWTIEGTSGEKTVTESKWLACTDPRPMLEFLRDKVSDRKLRLFAIAFCRRIWHLLTDERSRKGIETAEQYVDGGVAKEEMDQARSLSLAAFVEFRASESMGGEHVPTFKRAFIYPPCPTFAAYSTTLGDTQRNAIFVAEGIIFMAESRPTWRGIPEEHRPTLRPYQSDLFRDLFGNPFRPVTFSPAILTWNDSTVARLAQAAYDERHLPVGTLDIGRLAVLADALEEAGCTDPDILGHLRRSGHHVRGCWPVDLCLGKS